MHRERWLAEKRAEIAALGDVAVGDIVPSRRDFTQFVATQKQSIALVPRLARANPETGGVWPGLDLLELARRYDDADTAALAVRSAALHGGAIADLAAAAAATTAPILRDDLCLDRRQLYQSRLHGADAVLLPAAHLDPAALVELGAIAASMHMVAVIEVRSERELDAALAVANACVGLVCPGGHGFADLARVGALAARVPARRTTLLLGEVAALDDLRALDGLIDAAVVGDALLGAADPVAAIEAFIG